MRSIFPSVACTLREALWRDRHERTVIWYRAGVIDANAALAALEGLGFTTREAMQELKGECHDLTDDQHKGSCIHERG